MPRIVAAAENRQCLKDSRMYEHRVLFQEKSDWSCPVQRSVLPDEPWGKFDEYRRTLDLATM